MKQFFAYILAILCSYSASAQETNFAVQGTIRDAEQKPLPAVSILLLSSNDSSLQKTAITGNNGEFTLDHLKAGTYLVAATMVGYEKYISPMVTLDASHVTVSLPVIIMKLGDARTLKAVNVTGKKPFIEQDIDRVIVNVEAMISSAGSNALEVLSKSPGVLVTGNGAISLNGREGVLILIDGRPTYLAGEDLINYLKSLPGGTLDKIEIMSNPPAKYDASGNSGVINIRTRKNKVRGFNGSLTAGYTQAVYWKTNNSVNFNYRNNKINLFGNLSYAGSRDYVRTTILRQYQKTDGSADNQVDMDIFNKNVSDAVNLKLGMDFYMTSKTTLGVNLNGLTRPSSEKKYTTSDVFNGAASPDSTVYGDLYGKYKWKTAGLNLNMQHRFDSTGREMTVDLDYIRYSSGGDQFFENDIYLPGHTFKSQDNLVGRLPGDIDIYSAKTDFMYPLKNKLRVDFGGKVSYVKADNAAEYFSGLGSNLLPDYEKTNRFLYDENINAAYLNLRKEFNRWGVQVGLRVENTIAKGHQLGNAMKPDSSFRKNYTDLFPTVYFSYKLDSAAANNLVVSYGRRINRPAYNDLNPFLFFRDKFSYRAGNPFLKPQYADNIELSYKYKGSLSLTLLYNRTNGEIRETVEQDGDIFISRNANVGRNYVTGILLNSNVDITKWWMLSMHAEYLYRNYKATLYGEELNADLNTWGGSLYNQFKFKKGWSAELYAMYISENLLGQFLRDPLGQLDVSVQKMILQNRGSLRLSVKDIFHTLKIAGEITNINQARVHYSNVFDTRSVGLAFTYRFGKESNATRRNRRTGGADTEQQRASSN